MPFFKTFSFLLFGLTVSLVYGQSNLKEETTKLRNILNVFFVPVETDYEFLEKEAKKIELGRQLFYDKRLSFNSGISCNSCHDLNNYGTNGSYYLKSLENDNFFRDVPTLYNVTTLPMYNADGGINSLNEKLHSAFSNTFEMNVKDKNVIVERLKSIEAYNNLFELAYPNQEEPVDFNHIIDAIETFIKGLTTPAPIDEFIKGDDLALSKEQIEGGHIFNDKSCYSCHTGSNIGGQMIQKLGIEEPWPNQNDLGYYQVERLSDYKMFFRVAPLRNVDKTAPYFHDASSSKLWEAVKLMGKHERGMEISKDEALKISEFLKSLTGNIPLNYIKKPITLEN